MDTLRGSMQHGCITRLNYQEFTLWNCLVALAHLFMLSSRAEHAAVTFPGLFMRRGLDNRVYYMLAPQGQYYNYSGCGNTLNCNHPVVRQFIIACLRYWVTEVSAGQLDISLSSVLAQSVGLSDHHALDVANL